MKRRLLLGSSATDCLNKSSFSPSCCPLFGAYYCTVFAFIVYLALRSLPEVYPSGLPSESPPALVRTLTSDTFYLVCMCVCVFSEGREELGTAVRPFVHHPFFSFPHSLTTHQEKSGWYYPYFLRDNVRGPRSNFHPWVAFLSVSVYGPQAVSLSSNARQARDPSHARVR